MARIPVLVLLVLLGTGVSLAAASLGRRNAPTPVANDAAFHRHLRAAAESRDAMGLVDDLARWAPALCRAPLGPALRWSASGDAATHGSKVFALYAKDRAAYVELGGAPGDPRAAKPTPIPALSDCSQVVVKEAFAPMEEKPLSGDWDVIIACGTVGIAPPSGAANVSRARMRPAVKDGVQYGCGEPRGLFVMLRLDPETPGTDDGWVYGTIAPDGRVTSSGRVASCMSCHVGAPHGRLFGVSAGE